MSYLLGVQTANPILETDIAQSEGLMRKVSAGTYEAIQTNLTAVVDPTVTDDSGSGYAIGSRWINVSTDAEFICLDASVGAAVWKDTTAGGTGTHNLGGVLHIADTLANLNSKITDATLDDSSASRTPTGAASGDLAGTYPSPTVPHIALTNNPHSVTKTQVGLSDVQNLKMNLTATTDPTVNDDSGAGYAIGSRWINTSTDTEFVCMDATAANAIWTSTTPASGGYLLRDGSLPMLGNLNLDGNNLTNVEDFNGIKYWGTSATNPVSGTAGDRYYNTVLNEEMFYDGATSSWLSVAKMVITAGSQSTVSPGFYLRTPGYTLLDAANQGYMIPDTKLVWLAYTNYYTVSSTIEVINNGSIVGELVLPISNYAVASAMNIDLSAGRLSFRVKPGTGTLLNVILTSVLRQRL